MQAGVWIAVGCVILLTASTAWAQADDATSTGAVDAGSEVGADRTAAGAAKDPTAPASAAATPTTPPLETRRWYGWQTLSIDFAAGVVAVTYAFTNNGGSPAWLVLSAAPYVLGGPIVHAAHRKIGTGLGSLALRVGAPLVLGGLGFLVGGGSGSGGDNGWLGGAVGAIVGGVVGAVAAVTIDAAVLAYDHAPQAQTASRSGPQPSFAPMAYVGPRWIAIGGAGSF